MTTPKRLFVLLFVLALVSAVLISGSAQFEEGDGSCHMPVLLPRKDNSTQNGSAQENTSDPTSSEDVDSGSVGADDEDAPPSDESNEKRDEYDGEGTEGEADPGSGDPAGELTDDQGSSGDDDPPEQYRDPWTDRFKDPKVLILGGILLGALVLLMAVFLGYTKIKHDQLLDHEMRMSIYKHIKKHPGQHYRKIMDDLGLKSGVLTHHINMLEREEYIKSVQDGIYRRFYIYGVKPDDHHLLNQHQQNILNAVRAEPGMSQTDIANKLGITRMLVNYHLKVLTTENLVKVKKKGRSSACFPVEENT